MTNEEIAREAVEQIRKRTTHRIGFLPNAGARMKFILIVLSLPSCTLKDAPQTHPVLQTVYPEQNRGTPDIRSVYSDGAVRWE